MGRLKKPRKFHMDNSATIYPMVLKKMSQSLFGLGVVLRDRIRKEVFSEAIELAFQRHPSFKVRLYLGFFRPCFEENDKPYPLSDRRDFVLQPIDFARNNDYLFVTEIENNTVRMIFFHALCDATGAMEFFKTVLHAYFTLLHEPISDAGVRVFGDPATTDEEENAFERYHKKYPLISGARNMAGGYAFGVRGEHLPHHRFEGNRVSCKTQDLLSAAREKNCSITVLVCALLAQAVYLSHDSAPRKLPYVFFVPVNYRKFFPSDTLRNFTGFIRCTLPTKVPFDLDEWIAVFSANMKEQLVPEELQKKLSFSSLMSSNPVMRVLPYAVKRRISLWGRGLGKHPRQTMIVSNIGKVDFPETELIDRFMFYVNCNARTPENVGILSYREETQICFVRKIVSEDTEKTFCRLLSELLPCELSHEYTE